LGNPTKPLPSATFVTPKSDVITMADAIEESLEIKETSGTEKMSFAAIPVHFRPGSGKEKLFKLVIPGIEPPLGFYRVTGESAESISIESVDAPDTLDAVPDNDDNKEVASSPAEEIEDPDAGMSSGLEDVESDEESDDRSDALKQYPHATADGKPVAGFLLAPNGGDTDSQDVIVVVAEDGENVADALNRVGANHPDYKEVSLSEATKALGHDPLTADDNPIQVDANIPGNPQSPVAWLIKGKDKIAIVIGEDQSKEEAISSAQAKKPGYTLIMGAAEPKT